jgi:hypothetical protein
MKFWILSLGRGIFLWRFEFEFGVICFFCWNWFGFCCVGFYEVFGNNVEGNFFGEEPDDCFALNTYLPFACYWFALFCHADF